MASALSSDVSVESFASCVSDVRQLDIVGSEPAGPLTTATAGFVALSSVTILWD